MKFVRSVIVVGMVAVVCFVAGLVVRPYLKEDRLFSVYQQQIRGQPSSKQKPDEDGVFDTVAQTNFRNLITIRNSQDVERKRDALTSFLWRHTQSPFGRLPDKVEDHSLLLMNDILSIRSTERMVINMPLGVNSVAYLFAPMEPSSCLMFYQEGHRVSFLERKKLLRRLLDAGCHVVALSLPLTGGENSRPLLDHPRFGRVLLNDPDKFEIIETETLSTLQFFLTPPIVALNHVLASRRFERVGITGFSGGGWVATMVAALDPRFQYSYQLGQL